MLAFFSAVLVGTAGTFLFTNLYGSSPRGMIFHDYLSPTVIVQTISFFLLVNAQTTFTLSKNTMVKRLPEASFGIYLIHPLVIYILELFIPVKLLFKSSLPTLIILKLPLTIIFSWGIVEILLFIPIAGIMVGSFSAGFSRLKFTAFPLTVRRI